MTPTAGVLQRLLEYGPAHGEPRVEDGPVSWSCRPGTISPWSSKATDIAHNCGLSEIRRIERGIAYRGRAAIGVGVRDRRTAARPMTQVVLRTLDSAAVLFRHAEPRPVPAGRCCGGTALLAANGELGLALSDDEVDYLVESFSALHRNRATSN